MLCLMMRVFFQKITSAIFFSRRCLVQTRSSYASSFMGDDMEPAVYGVIY